MQRQDTSSAKVTVDREYDSPVVPFATAGTIITPGSYDWTTVAVNYVSNQGKRVYGSATVNLGGYYDGDRQSVQGAVNFIVGRTLLFEPNYTRNRIVLPGRPIYTSNVLNMRVSHSFSPNLFLKGFAQYNDDRRTASFNFLVWYIYKPGSDLYIVYNQGWDANLPVPQQVQRPEPIAGGEDDLLAGAVTGRRNRQSAGGGWNGTSPHTVCAKAQDSGPKPQAPVDAPYCVGALSPQMYFAKKSQFCCSAARLALGLVSPWPKPLNSDRRTGTF